MKLTKILKRKIVSSVKNFLSGKIEIHIGERHWVRYEPERVEYTSMNFLNTYWNSDLSETYELTGYEGDIDESGNFIALDLYVYKDEELKFNVYVLIKCSTKEILCISDDDLNHSKEIDVILKKHGHSGYKDGHSGYKDGE